MAYVVLKAANSPRPGNWILERSIDGQIFKPWQYYAISDAECLHRYSSLSFIHSLMHTWSINVN